MISGVDLGDEIILGPLGSHKKVERLLEQDAQHLVLGQEVADGGERGARLHVCPFQFAMDGADFALLDRVERLWVAFARDGGDERSGPFLPCAVRADDLVSQFERTEGHHTGMRSDDFLFLKGEALISSRRLVTSNMLLTLFLQRGKAGDRESPAPKPHGG